jgi:hypothetical protein
LQALRPIERSGRLRKYGRWGSLRRRNSAAIHHQGKSTAGGRHRSQHERASEHTLPATTRKANSAQARWAAAERLVMAV